jgi:multicomponent Na+:H+ antiporter subunit F
MNEWLIAATALLVGLVPCGIVCMRADVLDGLVALELGSATVTVVMMLLAEGFHRQAFIDLALVLAIASFAGSLTFARLLERRL